jgi:hypothetical protein
MTPKTQQLLAAALQSMVGEQNAPDDLNGVQHTGYKIPKSRSGKKAVICHVDPDAGWQLKKLALDRKTTVQKLLEEGLGDLFEKYHLPRAGL